MLRILIEFLLATAAASLGGALLYFFTPEWGLLGFFAGLILLLVGIAVAASALSKVHALLGGLFGIAIVICGVFVLFHPVPHWGPLQFLIGLLVTVLGLSYAALIIVSFGRDRQEISTTFDHWNKPKHPTRVNSHRDDVVSSDYDVDGR